MVNLTAKGITIANPLAGTVFTPLLPFGHFTPATVIIPHIDIVRPRQPLFFPADPTRHTTDALDALCVLFPGQHIDRESRPELDFFHIALRRHFGMQIRWQYYQLGSRTVRHWLYEGGVLLDDREYQGAGPRVGDMCERLYTRVLEGCK